MTLELDEKGKFFTDVIPKDTILSDILTLTHHIRGYVHVRRGERLSDEINRAEQFIAVTGAVIYSSGGEILSASDFLVVNREHIVWLMPVDKRRDTPAGTGG